MAQLRDSMSRRLIGGEDFDEEEVERTVTTHLDKLMLDMARHGKTWQDTTTRINTYQENKQHCDYCTVTTAGDTER